MNEMIRNAQSAVTHTSLDPQDWSEFRALAHRMLDETIDGIANVRARPVWQPIPDDVRAALKADVPREASDLADVYRRLARDGRLAGFEVTQRFYEIGSFDGMRETETYLLERGKT